MFKNKRYSLMLVLLVLLAATLACGLTGGEENQPPIPEETNPSQGELETMVAATMQFLAQQSTATQAAAGPQEEAPPSGEPAVPLFTFTPTVTATLTPEATNTLQPTFTPTLRANDPKVGLGSSDWHDNFTDGANWSLYSGDSDKVEIVDGRLWFTMFEPLDYSIWTISWLETKNFYLEVAAQTPSNCSGRDRYGLIFRSPDPNQGYIFSVSCDGEYRLSSWDGKDWEDIIEWDDHNAILAGPGQINRLGVMVEDKKISLYVNSYFLEAINDDTFPKSGRFGLMIASANTNDFVIAFDDMVYWELP